MPIHLVEDGMLVEANHVYLIPSKKEMIISEGRLLLSDRSVQKELTLPIDVFFRSLAQDCGSRAVAIVLSGGGSDGSRGIRDIREAGGLVIVQDTHSAQFDGMPKTALESGVAQWVLSPPEMPRVLVEHVQNPASTTTHTTPQGMGAVYRMLQSEYGLDFTDYKPTTVTRRIERRIALASTPDLEEYVNRLRRDRSELDVLYRDLLIGVTRFFRDADAFKVLEQDVLPDLLQRATKDAPLRIWVPGCATGEEPYSFAIALQDLMAKTGERPVKIFATDVHRGSLERAARGIYPAEAVAQVSPERLERYFLRTGNDYQVVPDVRQMVVFAAHDVIKDAPFTRVDLVSCRNMLIYLQPQRAAEGAVAVPLRAHPRWSAGPRSEREPRRAHEGLRDARQALADLPQAQRHAGRRRHAAPAEAHVRGRAHERDLDRWAAVQAQPFPSARHLRRAARRGHAAEPPRQRAAASSIHVFGGASRFLKPRDGRQGLDVLESVDGELRMVLLGGLKRARSWSRRSSCSRACRFDSRGKAELLQGDAAASPGARPRRASRAGVLRVRGGGRATSRREDQIDLDEVSREQLAVLEARAEQHEGEPAGRHRRARRAPTRSCRRRTRSSSRRTKSSRAPTRSCRASTRSFTRSTRSTSARSPS